LIFGIFGLYGSAILVAVGLLVGGLLRGLFDPEMIFDFWKLLRFVIVHIPFN
jgi:hypothetical protein